jgi:NAD-dependent dihydropyrimidine dehydrogenase PreA subunit
MRYLLNGSTLVLDPALCNGCGRCTEVCPHGVFSVVNRKAAIANRTDCMECGACRMNCVTRAIAVASGVGCAAAVLNSMRRKNDGCVSCDCG